MGNVISCLFDTCESCYDRYYPKCPYLQPRYVMPTLMVSSLAYTAIMKPGKCCCPKMTNLIYNTCLAAPVGLQLWVYFNSGLTMMRVLPRHQFGLVQASLYPKFFFLSTLFNFGSLSIFMKHNPLPWTESKLPYGIALASSFVLNVLNYTCFNPNSIKYNQKMHEIERNAGEGSSTIGKLMKDNKCESDPEYIAAKKKFYRFHGYSALAGILSFGCTVAESYLVANIQLF